MSNKEEPDTAPKPEQWYNITLGSSFKDPSSSKFCTLRYEFKPASIDKSQPGSMHKNKENRVSVEFHNNQQGKSKVIFEGSSEDYRENDAVLFFDGDTFRMERLHRAVKQLRHVRKPGESTASATGTTGVPAVSSPVGRGGKLQTSTKVTSHHPMQLEMERIEVNTHPMQLEVEQIEVNTHPMQLEVERIEVIAHPMQIEVERIDVGDLGTIGIKSGVENVNDNSCHPNPEITQTDALDIVRGDDDVSNTVDGEVNTNMGIIFPHQHEMEEEIADVRHEMEEEIADVDVNDDDLDKGCNAAEALRAQVNAEQEGKSSSSDESSDSEGSSGSESSESGSDSGSESSSSGSESNDDDSLKSI